VPATFPSHQAAVLPLKLWRPRLFDGVALVVGSAAPDLIYIVDGISFTVHTHAWLALVWWTVPVTLIVSLLIRLGAPIVATHVPRCGVLALRDYGTLGSHRYPIWVTVVSAALGGASHLAWDSCTHAKIDGGTVLFPVLAAEVWHGIRLWYLFQLVFSLIGAVVVGLAVIHIGRRRLLIAWHGQPPVRARRPGVFWGSACAVAGSLGVLLPFLPGSHGMHVIGARLMFVATASLLSGAAAVRIGAWARSGPGEGPDDMVCDPDGYPDTCDASPL
jgi:hypothetical protein